MNNQTSKTWARAESVLDRNTFGAEKLTIPELSQTEMVELHNKKHNMFFLFLFYKSIKVNNNLTK